jgi:hypothetical protein
LNQWSKNRPPKDHTRSLKILKDVGKDSLRIFKEGVRQLTSTENNSHQQKTTHIYIKQLTSTENNPQQQETRNKKQETRNKKQETRNKKQETRNKRDFCHQNTQYPPKKVDDPNNPTC